MNENMFIYYIFMNMCLLFMVQHPCNWLTDLGWLN
jgi:hypothetical protein